MGVAHAAAQVLLAAAQVSHPDAMHVARPIVLAGLVGVVCAWSAIDGWRRVPKRGMAWLIGSLFGGVLAGLLGVIGEAAFVDQTGVWALAGALTGGAAFTALLIIAPAGLGLLAGSVVDPAPGRAELNGLDGGAGSTSSAGPVGQPRQ